MSGQIGEGFFTMNNAPGHRGGAFEGVMLAALIILVALFVSMIVDTNAYGHTAILIGGIAIGSGAGALLSRSINRRRARRRAEFESEYRAEQDRETQRKLAEARAKGEI
ncbi:MAG: hypothetical protein AAF401_04460 [Pseudomonadota bacterium]